MVVLLDYLRRRMGSWMDIWSTSHLAQIDGQEMIKWPQHAQIALEVAFYVFLSNYIQSPSVTAYLRTHGWLADLVASLWTAFRVFQTYGQQKPTADAPAQSK